MDAKDLKTESTLGDRTNDGNAKYPPGSTALQCNNKPYQDIGSNSLGKVDVQTARPCAVIGPDRVVAPTSSVDPYFKKSTVEPWSSTDSYRRPPDYPLKLPDYHHPNRNISPRQTFQENMSRMMVPPSYNSVKSKEDHNFPVETVSPLRNDKLSVPIEAKYCDVPYSVNPMINEQKNIRNSDISATNMNPGLARCAPQGWSPASANNHVQKPYGAPDVYQYQEYQSCAGSRPVLVTRPHRTVHEEAGQVYSEPYYQEGGIRFKPYPSVKDRFQQTRYEYLGNYSNPFHPPPPFPSHKYDLQKPLHPHAYPGYAQVPLKYVESRIAEPIMSGYQRPINPQSNFNAVPYRNQVIHPAYGPVPSNCLQPTKYYPYPPDTSVKAIGPNKLAYDANHKLYGDYENVRNKSYPMTESFYINEMTRPHLMKGQVLPPNYPQINMHTMPPHAYYRKENPAMKGYNYGPHFRNIDASMNISGSSLSRLPSQFSPNAIAISPSDSNTSNDTTQTQGTSQEDCGYVSQSSSASIRSLDSGINRLPNDIYRRYNYNRFIPGLKSSSMMGKPELNTTTSGGSKNKKDIDVRQFLQMWNESEDENAENTNKDLSIKVISNNADSQSSNQEQLYVLGLVNVPSEELGKYEHIQKVSKLPENIKGYNSIELLNQFEEVIESSNLNHFIKPPISRDFHIPLKGSQGLGLPSRPISPLDVEAKISQSVIHKEVGCNFEIRPCSPKMLNVEVATPIQSILGERVIEKVSNPLIIPTSILHDVDGNIDSCNVIKQQDHRLLNDNLKVTSCKMINTQFPNNDTVDAIKTNYSLQDLESNSGVCLASLPRLDNDIELNFPEVNQQFINANKVDSVITTSTKDLPALDVDQKEMLQDQPSNEAEINLRCSPNIESENQFAKLSKYRKLKKKSSDSKDNNSPESNAQAMRKDSVIIKNPDNIKTQEIDRFSPTIRNLEHNPQRDPINLTVCAEDRINHDEIECNMNKPLDDRPNEIAIDFSLHSNEQFNITTSPNGRGKTKEENSISTHSDTSKDILVFDDSKDNKCTNSVYQSDNIEPKVYAENDNISFEKPNINVDNENNTKKSLERSTKPEIQTNNCQEQDIMDSLNDFHNSDIEESLNSVENDCKLTTARRLSRDCDSNKNVTVDSNEQIVTESENKNVDDKLLIQKKTLQCLEKKEEIKCYEENSVSAFEVNHPLEKDAYFKQKNGEFSVQKNPPYENPNEIVNQIENDNQETGKKLNSHERCHDIIYPYDKITYHISKELFSPWIQKLILHNEGFNCFATYAKNNKVTNKAAHNLHSDTSFNKNLHRTKPPETEVQDCEIKISHMESTSNKPSDVLEKVLYDDVSLTDSSSIQTDIGLDVAITDQYNTSTRNTKTVLCTDIVMSDEEKNRTSTLNTKKDSYCDIVMTNTEQNSAGVMETTVEESSEVKTYLPVMESMDDMSSETLKNSAVRLDLGHFNNDSVIESNQINLESPVICNTVSPNIVFNDISIPPKNINEKSESTSNNEECKPMSEIKYFETDIVTINNCPEENDVIINSKANTTRFIDTKDSTYDFIKCNLINKACFNQSIAEAHNDVHVITAKTIKWIPKSPSHDLSNGVNFEDVKSTTENKAHSCKDTEIQQRAHVVAIDNASDQYTNTMLLLESPDDSDGNRKLMNIDTSKKSLQNVNINTTDNITKNKPTDVCVDIVNSISENKTLPEPVNNSLGVIDIIEEGKKETEPVIARLNATDIVMLEPKSETVLLSNGRHTKDILQQNKNESKQVADCADITNIVQEDKIKNISESVSVNTINYVSDNKRDQDPGPSAVDKTNIIDVILEHKEKTDPVASCICTIDVLKNEKEMDLVATHIDNIGNVKEDKTKTKLVSACSDTTARELICDPVTEQLAISPDDAVNKVLENYDKNIKVVNINKISNHEIGSHTVKDINEFRVANIPESFHSNICSINMPNVSPEYIIKDMAVDNTIRKECTVNSHMDDIVAEKNYNSSAGGLAEEIVNNLEPQYVFIESNGNCDNTKIENINVIKCTDDNVDMEKDTHIKKSSNCHSRQAIKHDVTGSSVDVTSTAIPNQESSIDPHSEVYNDCDAQEENQHKGLQALDSFKNLQYRFNLPSNSKRKSLKRSLSDSALDICNIECPQNLKIQESNNELILWPNKRKRNIEFENIIEPQVIAESYCNMIHNNRRNSISSIYNEENVSICILIDNDNCIITDDSDETQKICFTELPEGCLIQGDASNDEGISDSTTEIEPIQEDINYAYAFGQEMNCINDDKTFDESWVEDVACIETVVSDDVSEDIVVSASASPKDVDITDEESNDDEAGIFVINYHSDKLKKIYGDKMCNEDAQLVDTLYRTPQMNVNKTLVCRESHIIEGCNRYYDKESLEKVLSESNAHETAIGDLDKDSFETASYSPNYTNSTQETKEKEILSGCLSLSYCKTSPCNISKTETEENIDYPQISLKTQDDTVHSCESSVDNVFSYSQREESPKRTISSSPEVSSTTSEERNSCILLKITNCRGSRTSQVNSVHTDKNSNRVSCKYTEEKEYIKSNLPNRPLITKAAQKYIPPLKETIGDLKVKLCLPQNSLLKLKQLKTSKEEPKLNITKHNIVNTYRKEIPKKPKPKFEDVLKSIDELQVKMHKEKNKKNKKSIPKVVIKKNGNGSHYASTSNRSTYNPDLTGRKWQPWVFLEKNGFIDEMALNNKTRAIFNHRKNTYVLAETFKKYKAMNCAKFVISQPKSSDSTGHLKYTIRLKHRY